ncbi:MAG: hypothetical protein H7Z74_05985 [Anaerolineae bacterium]|nr:hypothetical protein [Gemmatimonadaceae bacterium]
MNRKIGQLVLASLLSLSFASLAASQGVASVPDKVAAVGPTMEAAASAVRWAPARLQMEAQSDSSAAVLAMAPSRRTQSKVLMIVGGAAVLIGAIAGDDAGTVLIVGGAGFGLYGLYLYLTS